MLQAARASAHVLPFQEAVWDPPGQGLSQTHTCLGWELLGQENHS